jgi:hypothetical protein
MNMFAENGFAITDHTTARRPALERPTKHCNTPYDYSTRWITHPGPESPIAPEPEELYKTSYLAAPNVGRDSRRFAKHAESKYDAIRWNEQRFKETVARMDRKIVDVHEKNMRDIRAQRVGHLAALEARHKLEHYYFFE